MFDFFGIKQLKMKKQELEAEIEHLRAVALQVNGEKQKIQEELKHAYNQIRILATENKRINEELSIVKMVNEANNKYNDNERNY